MSRKERMAAFLARGGAKPRPKPPVPPKPRRATAAPLEQRRQRNRITRPTVDEAAIADSKALLEAARATKSFVSIGPMHLAILIRLAESANVADDPASQMARLLDKLPTYDPTWPDDFRAMWSGWADQFWRWAHPPAENGAHGPSGEDASAGKDGA